MARRKSVRRNRARSERAAASPFQPNPARESPAAALEQAIEQERARLMKAHAVLGCIVLALDCERSNEPGRPYYPVVVELARELVNESINGLDSVNIHPLLSG
ncbi:MAG TPA: hypothetical protein VFY39_11600 [Gammaproteobacteria bacterium]|nr:hypothetical protein [Gammaproteobacteria bacterium]